MKGTIGNTWFICRYYYLFSVAVKWDWCSSNWWMCSPVRRGRRPKPFDRKNEPNGPLCSQTPSTSNSRGSFAPHDRGTGRPRFWLSWLWAKVEHRWWGVDFEKTYRGNKGRFVSTCSLTNNYCSTIWLAHTQSDCWDRRFLSSQPRSRLKSLHRLLSLDEYICQPRTKRWLDWSASRWKKKEVKSNLQVFSCVKTNQLVSSVCVHGRASRWKNKTRQIKWVLDLDLCTWHVIYVSKHFKTKEVEKVVSKNAAFRHCTIR